MKSDLAMYVIAIVCFILAAIIISGLVSVGTDLTTYTLTIAFAALGVIFIGIGYTLRPKMPIVTTPSETKLEKVKIPETTSTAEPLEVTETIETMPTVQPPTAEMEETRIGLVDVKGIGPKRAEQLKRLGIYTIYDLAEANAEDLAKKTELSPKITRRWIEEAKKLVGKT